jgi:tartrate dehydratase beta subunit/fumarate hydratase class I family protein
MNFFKPKSSNIRITKVIVKKGNGCRMIMAPCLKDTEVIYFCDARETIAKKFEIRSFPSLITLDKKSNRIEVIAVTAPNGKKWNTLFTKDK